MTASLLINCVPILPSGIKDFLHTHTKDIYLKEFIVRNLHLVGLCLELSQVMKTMVSYLNKCRDRVFLNILEYINDPTAVNEFPVT